jgi:agmatinase
MRSPQFDYVHFYEGPVSFFRAPSKLASELQQGEVAALGVPLDSWVLGRNGQRYGPRAIREASLYLAGYYGLQTVPGYLDISSGEVVTVPEEARIFDLGDVPIVQTDIQGQVDAIDGCVAEVVQRGAIPVLLGGDHFLPYPGVRGVLRGLREAGREVRIGYLHIDSHLDFWDEFRRMGRYHHGTAARRVSELDGVEHVVFWGTNGSHVVEPSQFEVMRKRGMIAYTTPAIRRRGVTTSITEAFERVSDGVDFVYVSLDIDVIDGAHAPGTHSIVVEGLTSGEYLAAMRTLGTFDKIRALDVCEVLPQHDAGGGRTSHLAALGILGLLGRRFLDSRPMFRPDEISEVFAL